MKYTEQDSVRVIPGIGQVAQTALERLGIFRIGDLLNWYPRLYLDGSRPTLIANLISGKLTAINVTVLRLSKRRSQGKGLEMLEVATEDESGQIIVRWFNQPYLAQKLVTGSKWILIGTPVRFRGEWTMLSPLIEEAPLVLAIYAQTRGVSSKMLRHYLNWVLRQVKLSEDELPAQVLERENLLPRAQALRVLHQPPNLAVMEAARTRVAFEEVFWFFLHMSLSQQRNLEETGIKIPCDLPYLRKLVAKLPFQLTAGQKRAVWQMVQEMETGRPMTRLLNGDVGSGKTIIAGLLGAVAAKSGYQSIILVPTEILAKQHTDTLSKLLAPGGIIVAIWTAAQKDDLEKADLIIGTHALLREEFKLPRLGLVVIDEQHRFGVRQRRWLRQQSESRPHLLSMTATPIPRTLALALYGDLSVTLLKDKPKDRLPIVTQLISPSEREVMHQRILLELSLGHQVFVICPLIEEKKSKAEDDPRLELFSDEELGAKEKKTVLAEVEKLRQEHPEYGTIAAVHGKMKPQKKREIMELMAKGEIQILVATSVIEVGVDIPQATVMIIEGAERFGLAQLHQFRGRVGRSAKPSYCFLCPTFQNEATQKRLRVLVHSQSGFEIAEQDLRLRGPGELIGQAQSGLPDFKMASLTDLDFLNHVKEVVETFIIENPQLLTSYREKIYSTLPGSLE